MKRILLFLLAAALVLSFSSCSLLGFGSSKIGFGSQTVQTEKNDEKNEPTYTITYDLGDGTSNKVTYRSSDPDYAPEDPTRAGYRFRYWTLDGKDGQYNGVVKSGSSGDITFHAVWELVTYSLTYENAGDSHGNPAAYTVESDPVTLAEPTKTGYYFLGWQLDDGQLQKEVTIPKGSTGDRVFRAVWSATPFSFAVKTDVEGAAVTASIAGNLLKTDTPIRVSAAVYAGNKQFSHWEANGTKVSESALYTFPMPAKNLELKAIYRDLSWLSYDMASGTGLTVSNLLSAAPTRFLGAGISPDDYTLTATGVTISAAFLQTLVTGDYRFYIASLSGSTVTQERVFTLRVVDNRSSLPFTDPASYTGNAKTYYEKPTFDYGGKTYHRVATTEEEFRAMVEYFVLVDGVLQMQRDNDKTKEYSFDFYLFGDLETFSKHVTDISFPMHPAISYKSSKLTSEEGATITLTVKYQDGLNSVTSPQAKDPIGDRQKLLTAAGRAADFNSFPIDALTPTAPVRTLYELEVLPYGFKPAFAASAADAETVYNAARAILRAIVDDGMDDYAKVAAIYAWLGENVTYDQAAFSASDSSYAAYTLKGALIDRVAVCDGYASAFRLLCQIEGIHAEEVTGLCLQQGNLSGHAWSKVWIGGAVYGVDSTWARPLGSDFVTMKYLFMDEAALLATQHYENETIDSKTGNITPIRVITLADASIPLYRATVITQSGYDYTVETKTEFDALVLYLQTNNIGAAEFVLANSDLTLYSTSAYTVYSTKGSDLCFIEFE